MCVCSLNDNKTGEGDCPYCVHFNEHGFVAVDWTDQPIQQTEVKKENTLTTIDLTECDDKPISLRRSAWLKK